MHSTFPIFKKRRSIFKKKQNPKGQISIYVILGLILFIIIGIVFFYYNLTQKQNVQEEAQKIQVLNLQAQEVNKYIKDCIRGKAFEGLKRLGQTGGYFDVPNLIEFQGTALWQVDQVNIQPFLNQTQDRFVDYLNENIPKCIDNLNISQYGFELESKPPKALVEFGNSDVTIKVNYPIKLSKEKFTKEFNDFFNTFNIRYRAIYEAASEVNARLFDGDFDIKNPLKKLDYIKNLDFDISYKTPQDNFIVFTVTDKKSVTPENQNYIINFVGRLGNSTLKKVTMLQLNSATNPVALPFTIFSVDKRAQLDMTSGTTISKKGQSVEEISVYQQYINETVTKDVPVHKINDKVVEKKDLTYAITDPVYAFEPDGLLFNKIQKLTLYYQGDENLEKGVGILMGKKNTENESKGEFWVPIPSHDQPEQKRVAANILGFTKFTAVRCAAQSLKYATGEHFFEPKGTCYTNLAILILAIILIAYLFIIAPFLVGILGGTQGAIAGATAEAIGTPILGVSLGTITAVTAAIAVVGTTIGGTTTAFYETADNCETFYPMCDQNIEISQSGDGQGECVPKATNGAGGESISAAGGTGGGQRVAAGQKSNVCAVNEKCGGFVEKTICKKCTVKCTASYY